MENNDMISGGQVLFNSGENSKRTQKSQPFFEVRQLIIQV